jgi:hypothetical protein
MDEAQFRRILEEFHGHREEIHEEFRAQREEIHDGFRVQRQEIREEFEASREQWRAEFEASRAEWRAEFVASQEEQRKRFAAIDAGMANDRDVARKMLLELKEGREVLADIRHGIQSATAGLHHVLDELRREDGPSPSSA